MRPQGNEQEARRNKHVRSAPSKIAVKALGEEVLDGILDKSPNPLLLILDCVQDPHNLGAILRTADGAGVDAVIAPGTNPWALRRRCCAFPSALRKRCLLFR
nr:TrmH family RNA methyltransferase [Akkermansia muciniphila]